MALLKQEEYYKDPPKREIIDGIITLMSPSGGIYHNIAKGNLGSLLGPYLFNKTCQLFVDGVDVFLSDDNTYVPDLAVVCDKSKYEGKKGIFGAPDLVIEVLSPSTTWRDRGRKKEVYGQSGVKEYWLVDTRNFLVEVYLLQGKTLELDSVYHLLDREEIEMLKKEGKEIPPDSFAVNIFPDLIISLYDVFKNIFEEV
ncbi:MAG: Uma2 family endonuclease [Defluviitaleaceae bacterium]|nr:Uma2 family endonuclease [Defluviitaleaceae bacterium]